MEIAATLSLACNIIQLIETGLKVTGIFKRAFNNTWTIEQQDALKHMTDAANELQRAMIPPLNKDDSELCDIAKKCLAGMSRLENALKPSTSSTDFGDKFKCGMKAVLSSLSGELKRIESEIQSLREDLEVRILTRL